MTMVPSQNLSEKIQQHFQGGYVSEDCFKYATGYCKSGERESGFDGMSQIVRGGGGEEGYEYNYYRGGSERDETDNFINGNWLLLGSDSIVDDEDNNDMAHDQEDSRTNSDLNNNNNNNNTNEQEEGSTSKQQHDTWLQLGIGAGGGIASHSTDPAVNFKMDSTTAGLVELDLLSPGGGHNVMLMRPPPGGPIFQPRLARPNLESSNASFFLHPGLVGLGIAGGPSYGPGPPIGWGFRQHNYLSSTNSPSSTPSQSSLMAMGMGSYFGRPFPVHDGSAGPSSDVRVIAPPRRPHSGVWFMLQASPNQVKEPFLPQIPKSYLRIKDERMTIRLLMKYLVNKLRLGSENEIEIRCRGEKVGPLLTLQHVRDTIWASSPDFTLHHPNSHLMLLHYSTPL